MQIVFVTIIIREKEIEDFFLIPYLIICEWLWYEENFICQRL